MKPLRGFKWILVKFTSIYGIPSRFLKNHLNLYKTYGTVPQLLA